MTTKSKYLKNYLLGFTDAEGCFSIALKREPSARFGWALDPLFQVTQHKSGGQILQMFKKELGCGRIIVKPGQPDLLVYIVDNRRQLVEKVIPFFRRYRLLVKDSDFQRFSEIIDGMERKDHFHADSFIALIRNAFHMNLEGKQRRYKLEDVVKEIETNAGSPETVRQAQAE